MSLGLSLSLSPSLSLSLKLSSSAEPKVNGLTKLFHESGPKSELRIDGLNNLPNQIPGNSWSRFLAHYLPQRQANISANCFLTRPKF